MGLAPFLGPPLLKPDFLQGHRRGKQRLSLLRLRTWADIGLIDLPAVVPAMQAHGWWICHRFQRVSPFRPGRGCLPGAGRANYGGSFPKNCE